MKRSELRQIIKEELLKEENYSGMNNPQASKKLERHITEFLNSLKDPAALIVNIELRPIVLNAIKNSNIDESEKKKVIKYFKLS